MLVSWQTGQAALLDDATIVAVARETGASAATVALAWALRSGVAIIPKSSHTERIRSNRVEALALAPRLTADQMARLDGLDRQFHYLAAGWKGYAWREGQTLEELYDDVPPQRGSGASEARWLAALSFMPLLALGVLAFRNAQQRLRPIYGRGLCGEAYD